MLLNHAESEQAYLAVYSDADRKSDRPLLEKPTPSNMLKFMRKARDAREQAQRCGALRYLMLQCLLGAVFNPKNTEVVKFLAPWLFEESVLHPGETHWSAACQREKITLDNYQQYLPGPVTHPSEYKRGAGVPVPHAHPGTKLQMVRGAGGRKKTVVHWQFYAGRVKVRVHVPGGVKTVEFAVHHAVATVNSGPPRRDGDQASHMLDGWAGCARDVNIFAVRWEVRAGAVGGCLLAARPVAALTISPPRWTAAQGAQPAPHHVRRRPQRGAGPGGVCAGLACCAPVGRRGCQGGAGGARWGGSIRRRRPRLLRRGRRRDHRERACLQAIGHPFSSVRLILRTCAFSLVGAVVVHCRPNLRAT